MFDIPKQTTSYVAPAEPIDVTDRYLVRLEELHDEGVSKFADPDDKNPPRRIRWEFTVFHMDGSPILDLNDAPFRHLEWTSSRTGKANGKVAVARQYMEALLGRPLDDSEITGDMAQQLLDKAAVALFEEQEKTTAAGESYNRLHILKLAPRKAPAANGATKTAPAMSQRQAVAAVPQRRGATALAEAEDEVPF